MEVIETLQELNNLFSETMLYEFADNEIAPGNRLIVKHLSMTALDRALLALNDDWYIYFSAKNNDWHPKVALPY